MILILITCLLEIAATTTTFVGLFTDNANTYSWGVVGLLLAFAPVVLYYFIESIVLILKDE